MSISACCLPHISRVRCFASMDPAAGDLGISGYEVESLSRIFVELYFTSIFSVACNLVVGQMLAHLERNPAKYCLCCGSTSDGGKILDANCRSDRDTGAPSSILSDGTRATITGRYCTPAVDMRDTNGLFLASRFNIFCACSSANPNDST